MDEQISNILDYIGSYLSQKDLIPGVFTVNDIVVAIEQDVTIPMYKANPEFESQVNESKRYTIN